MQVQSKSQTRGPSQPRQATVDHSEKASADLLRLNVNVSSLLSSWKRCQRKLLDSFIGDEDTGEIREQLQRTWSHCKLITAVDFLDKMASRTEDLAAALRSSRDSLTHLANARKEYAECLKALPEDILSQILECADSPDQLRVFSSVNRKFRRVSLKLTRCWAELTCSSNLHFVGLCLERSKGQDLSIVIDGCEEDKVFAFLDVVLPHCSRFGSLEVNVADDYGDGVNYVELDTFMKMCSRLRDLEMPRLHTVVLKQLAEESNSRQNFLHPDNVFHPSWKIPYLRDITLENFIPSSTDFEACRLVSLNLIIDCSDDVDIPSLRDLNPVTRLLDRAPSLTSLRLEIYLATGPGRGLKIPTIRLPSVQEFTLEFKSVVSSAQHDPQRLYEELEENSIIVQRLCMPNLQIYDLTLEVVAYDRGAAHHSILSRNPSPGLLQKWFPDPRRHSRLKQTRIAYRIFEALENVGVWNFAVDTICNTETYILSTDIDPRFSYRASEPPQVPRLKKLVLEGCPQLTASSLRSLISGLETARAMKTLETIEVRYRRELWCMLNASGLRSRIPANVEVTFVKPTKIPNCHMLAY